MCSLRACRAANVLEVKLVNRQEAARSQEKEHERKTKHRKVENIQSGQKGTFMKNFSNATNK